MESVQIGEWILLVDVEKTTKALDLITYQCVSKDCQNFVAACASLDKVVLDFAECLAIDLSKPSQLSCHRLEDNSSVMYSGQYHVIGEVEAGEIDGWDAIVGQHCFSITDEYTHIPTMMKEPTIEISFEVVLPWVLE
ncbi:hypothetical protein [Solibacillus sp. FSL H8-0538]|uniref:hypothetical protein n=1 Tax=Solibacillus sp. FSL H8-0538 TaxID=2921400 RepID=UPI0030FA83F9